MDLQRVLFGRITYGSTHESLGRATVSALLIRAATAIRQISVSHKRIIIEFNIDEILSDSPQSRELMIEHELETSVIRASEVGECWRPGISYERMTDALLSESYKAYARVCDPTARMGVNEKAITILRDIYFDEWPDVAQWIPVWIP